MSDLDLGLALIEQMRPVRCEWKESQQPDIGFVAEEVAKLDKRLITRNASGEVEGVKYERLTAVLAQAVQELSARNELQAHDMAKLHAANAELRARLDVIERRLSIHSRLGLTRRALHQGSPDCLVTDTGASGAGTAGCAPQEQGQKRRYLSRKRTCAVMTRFARNLRIGCCGWSRCVPGLPVVCCGSVVAATRCARIASSGAASLSVISQESS